VAGPLTGVHEAWAAEVGPAGGDLDRLSGSPQALPNSYFKRMNSPHTGFEEVMHPRDAQVT